MSDATQHHDDQPLPSKEQSKGQQALIWVLIIAVGVLFGMGPAIGILRGEGQIETSVAEARRFDRVEQKLRRIGVPSITYSENGPQYLLSPFAGREYAIEQVEGYLWRAGLAEERGLMPKGDTLDQVVIDFLAVEMRDGGSVGTLLKEYAGGEHGVPASELRWYLQILNAERNLSDRAMVAPLIPSTVIPGVRGLVHDRVEIAEVELSAAPFLAAHREGAVLPRAGLDRGQRLRQ
ncbi:MAG: hypothetical protein ACYTF0_05865 [Planctomycetota bacterium]